MSQSKPKAGTSLEKLVKTYVYLLHKKPLLTKAVTSGCTAAIGNVISQLLVGGPKDPIKWRSVAAFAVTGGIFVGPMIHVFYIWLDKWMPKSKQPSLVNMILRVLLDRVVFAPPFLFVYFYLIAILEGQSSEAAMAKIRDIFWPTVKMNWKTWTPFQFINVNFVSQEYRALVSSVMSLLWTVYIATTRR